MLHIIWSIIVGFIVGWIAKSFLGFQMGFLLTVLLGIGGSIIGGLIGRLFSRPAPGSAFHPAGFIMSVICAILLLLLLGKYGGWIAPLHRPFFFFSPPPRVFPVCSSLCPSEGGDLGCSRRCG